MIKSIEKQMLSKIYGMGRGWAFSRKDFSLISYTETIDKSLQRLANQGVIRRLARGLYDYPRYSHLLQQTLGPDMDQVAHALARKFGWNIQITGNAALNMMGLSTQVPTRYIYHSDGPSKTYQFEKFELTFKKSHFTHSNLKLDQSTLLVQAINALGNAHVKAKEIEIMAHYLKNQGMMSNKLKTAIAKDTQYVTSWIQEIIMKVLQHTESLEKKT